MRPLAQITVLLFCAMAAPLAAKDVSDRPPEGFFNGVYDYVGRTGAGEQINDKALIVEKDGKLDIRFCQGRKPLAMLTPSAGAEDRRYFEGDGEFCFYTIDGGNYPVILCRVADGGLITYFPDTTTEADSCQ